MHSCPRTRRINRGNLGRTSPWRNHASRMEFRDRCIVELEDSIDLRSGAPARTLGVPRDSNNERRRTLSACWGRPFLARNYILGNWNSREDPCLVITISRAAGNVRIAMPIVIICSRRETISDTRSARDSRGNGRVELELCCGTRRFLTENPLRSGRSGSLRKRRAGRRGAPLSGDQHQGQE